MTTLLLLLVLSQPTLEQFTPVEGFADLEAMTTPSGFGLLLIQSGDMRENEALAQEVLEILDIL